MRKIKLMLSIVFLLGLMPSVIAYNIYWASGVDKAIFKEIINSTNITLFYGLNNIYINCDKTIYNSPICSKLNNFDTFDGCYTTERNIYLYDTCNYVFKPYPFKCNSKCPELSYRVKNMYRYILTHELCHNYYWINKRILNDESLIEKCVKENARKNN